MRIKVVIMMTMLSIGMGLAGNVKVVKTEYTGADFDFSGAYVTVNVKLQASNVAEGECGCFVLLKNERWDGENMTISKLSKLCDALCVGDAELEPVAASKTVDVPINIMLEQNRMTGNDTVLYMKTFIVDFNKKAIIAQGEMIRFSPDTQETRAQMIGKAAEIAGGLFGALLSSGSDKDIPDGYKKCEACEGKGYERGTSFKCEDCNGKGYVEKDFWDYGEERLNKSISEDYDKLKNGDNNNKNDKKSKEEQEDGLGNILDDLFGF